MKQPIPPGEILLEEYLKPMGISQNAMARAIGVSPRAINEIVLDDGRSHRPCRFVLAPSLVNRTSSGMASKSSATSVSWQGTGTDWLPTFNRLRPWWPVAKPAAALGRRCNLEVGKVMANYSKGVLVPQERFELEEGKEVVVSVGETASEDGAVKSLKEAAGGWIGMHDPEQLKRMIYEARINGSRQPPEL